MDDEDTMLPWDVDDHCHDELTFFEYDSALAGNEFKLKCRGKEKGTRMHYHLYIPLALLDIHLDLNKMWAHLLNGSCANRVCR